MSDRLVEAPGQQLRLARDVSVDVRDGVAWGRGVLAGTVVSPEGLDEAFVSGEILPDWYDDWLLIERERFRQLRAHALERLCERLTAAGRFGEAMEAGLAAVKDEPLRESAHRAVIRVCLAEGNRADALRQYRLFGRLLREQLDVPPSSQLEALLRPVTAG